MKTTVLFIIAAFVVSGAATVQAQQSDTRVYGDYSCGQRHYYPYHHASTAAEGYLRGVAAAIHAQGQYNRMAAQAMVLAEQARALRIQNCELAANTRFSMREANQQARARTRRPRITGEQAEQMAAKAKPNRLSPQELNPRSGHVSWPPALEAEEFCQSRQQMESLLARRAADGRLGADDMARANDAVRLILSTLRGRIRAMRPMEYTAARRFAEQLAYEVRQPVDSTTAELAMVQPSR